MATRLAIINHGYHSGLRDTITGSECVTDRGVEITEDCSRWATQDYRIFLMFSRMRVGRVVAITRCQRERNGMEYLAHFFVDAIDAEPSIDGWAKALQMDASTLRSLIKDHTPKA